MLLVIGTVRLPPQNLERARPIMAEMVTASRAEPGCLDYGYAEDVLEPGLIHVREVWQEQAAPGIFAAPTSPHGGRLGRNWASAIAG